MVNPSLVISKESLKDRGGVGRTPEFRSPTQYSGHAVHTVLTYCSKNYLTHEAFNHFPPPSKKIAYV
jgi:hypothetical protein